MMHRLAATLASLLLLGAPALAGVKAGAPRTPVTYLTPMSAHSQTFTHLPGDPDAKTVSLDVAAIAAIGDGDEIFEIEVNYDGDGATSAWTAERDFDPKFEAILASTQSKARLVATSLGKYQRSYWFVVHEPESGIVRAFRSLPQPPGAAIAVLRSNRETLESLKPTAAELAAARGKH